MAFSLQYDYLTQNNQELLDKVRQARTCYEGIQQQKQAGELGFTKLPYQTREDLQQLMELAESVRQEFKQVIVIGIGGSDLGARAVHRALNHQFYNLKPSSPQVYFLGDTTDPVAIQEVLDVVDLTQVAIIVISKSGNTVEQMSTFVYLRSLLINEVGEEKSKSQIIVLTDGEKGTLRDIVNQEGYRSLPIPGDVGGRFSVLSTVGLFPLAIAGIDIMQLLAGARSMEEHDSAGAESNMPLLYAVSQMQHYEAGRHISVLMPYAYSLREVGFWFRQLWAESLGKKRGDENVGPTPIAAVGPTDQHSQVQLYMEGPHDKVITFITVKKPATNMTVPEAFSDQEGVKYLKGHNFAEILAAEHASTAYALHTAGRPSCTIVLDELDAFSIGQLLQFFELAVAYAGAILGINTFDQPGVELGKQYMYGLLGRPGFQDKTVPELGSEFTLTIS